MFKNVRRKVANAISPEKAQDYPFVELKLMSAEREHEKYTKLVHERFEKEHGRKAINDKEAWNWDRKIIAEIYKEIEDKENTPDSSKNQG